MEDPPLDFPGYKSTALRAPRNERIQLPLGPTELTGPVFGDEPASASSTTTSPASTTASRSASGSSSTAA